MYLPPDDKTASRNLSDTNHMYIAQTDVFYATIPYQEFKETNDVERIDNHHSITQTPSGSR